MRPLKNPCEITVVGGGLAGLVAARQAVRMGKLVTLFEGSGIYGGQVATVSHLEGLPFPGQFSGQDLAIHLLEEIRKLGVLVVESAVASVTRGERVTLVDELGKRWYPGTLIVAAGASLRRLGVPGEQAMIGRGVSQCASCDGGFFSHQNVVVVGGGDSAVQEALELSKLCSHVTVVSRSPLKAARERIDKLAGQGNVSFLWENEVSEIVGEDTVRAVRLRRLKDGVATELACAAVFPFVGVAPNSAFLPAELLSPSGHVRTDERFVTDAAGILAIGAVREGFGGSLVEAMAEGIAAATVAAGSF